jgi:predicted PurR-regulated permease PerM
VLNIQLSTRALLVLLGVLFGLWALFRLWEIVVILSAAFIFMAALLPYVEWLTRHHIHRVVAVLILLFAFLLAFAGLAVLVVPALVEETRDVRESLPQDAARADELLSRLGIETNLEQTVNEIEWSRLLSGRAALDFGQRILVAVVSFITIVVLTAYLLVDAPRLSRFLYQFVAPGHEPGVQRFLGRLRRVVGGYIRGQFITSIAIATFTSGVMLALQLPNAVAFGVLRRDRRYHSARWGLLGGWPPGAGGSTGVAREGRYRPGGAARLSAV